MCVSQECARYQLSPCRASYKGSYANQLQAVLSRVARRCCRANTFCLQLRACFQWADEFHSRDRYFHAGSYPDGESKWTIGIVSIDNIPV